MYIRQLVILAFLSLTLVFGFSIGGCSDDDDSEDSPKKIVAPYRIDRDGFSIVWISGTPYEMGYQHGTLLRKELITAYDFVMKDPMLRLMVPMAREYGMVDAAYENSYPDIVEECQGLIDALEGTEWTMELCMVLNFGDVFVEALPPGLAKRSFKAGCSQFVAYGDATIDGRLYHGRILDWSKIDYILNYPVIFVRQPNDGLAHAYIGFPANLSPYSGINEAGITANSNEADPIGPEVTAPTGRSHVQMLGQMLKKASTLEEAKTYIKGEKHMSAELIMASDPNSNDGAVFEMNAADVGIRSPVDGVLYMTNHFISPETGEMDIEGPSSLKRFKRLEQLITPDGVDTKYGKIDPATIVEIMRDRVDPDTGEEAPADTFDNNAGLATNGAIFQIVYDPEKLHFWVASGVDGIPVPAQRFVGFSLGKLLGLPGATEVDPPYFE